MKKVFIIFALMFSVVFFTNYAFAGCECELVDYDPFWVDPNNPGESHAVGIYECPSPVTLNNMLIVTTFGFDTIRRINNSGWLAWDLGNNTYRVFVDGAYYWMVYAAFYEPWEVFQTVKVY